MAEEWTDLVWVAISLIAFATVLTLAFNFMQLGKDLTNTLYQEQADAAKVKEVQTFLPYDNVELSGSEAFAAAVKLSNDGYPVIIMLHNTETSGRVRSVLMYDSMYDPDTILTNVDTVTVNKNSIADFNATLTCLKSHDNHVEWISTMDYTTPALLDEFDRLAKLNNSSKPTFSEYTFTSQILEDAAGRPMGLALHWR